MGHYLYEGKNLQGKVVKGQVEAATDTEARVKLRAHKIIPLKVVEKSAVKSGKGTKGLFAPSMGVKSKDLQVFSRQFATMINSGIPIVQSLDILIGQTVSPGLKRCLIEVKASVEGGKRLAEAIEGYPKIFDRLYVNLVHAGEEGGVLDTILGRLASYIEKNTKLKNKVTGAMWYPAGILGVAAIVITALMTFVIPKFEKLFASSGQTLPAMTQFVIGASHFVQNYFLLIFIAIAVFCTAFVRYYQTQAGRATIDAIVIKVPIFGPLIQKSAVARFTRTMSTMLGCGVGILDSLQICSSIVGNYVIEKALLRCKAAVSEGKSIAQPLIQEPAIPMMVSQMIGVGEATGKLDVMLGKIADFYEEEVDYAVGSLTSLMEPIMMVILGGIIAVLVIAMYLPIFSLAGATGN